MLTRIVKLASKNQNDKVIMNLEEKNEPTMAKRRRQCTSNNQISGQEEPD